MVRKHAFYRCASRTMAPGSAALADHPATVNLREDALVSALNGWIGGLFLPDNVDATVAALIDSRPVDAVSVDLPAAKARRASIDERQAEAQDLGEDPRRRARIGEELALLRQIEKILSRS